MSVSTDYPASVEFFLDGVSRGAVSIGSSSTILIVELPVTGLSAGTKYVVATTATSEKGAAIGGQIEFTTPPAPQISTLPPRAITVNSATLRASVNLNGLATTVEFFLGRVVGLPPYTVDSVSMGKVLAGSGTDTVSVELPVSALVSGLYIVTTTASSSGGSNNGGPVRFLTLGLTGPPEITTLAPGAITANSATLRASVNPNGFATTVVFYLKGVRQGTIPVASGNQTVSLELPVSALAPGTYTVTTTASNSYGSNYGAPVQFTTLPSQKSPRMSLEPAPEGGMQMRVTFPGIPGLTYRVQSTDGLAPANWVDRATLPADTLGSFNFIEPPPLPSQRFYRFVYP